MSEIKDRIKALIKKHQFASLATVTEDGKPWVRYVVTRGSDDMTIRLGTRLDSRKVQHIEKSPEVHIVLGMINPATGKEFVQVQGTAVVVTDRAEREAIWYGHLERYFTGIDDPAFGVVIVKPYRIELYGIEGTEPGLVGVWEDESA